MAARGSDNLPMLTWPGRDSRAPRAFPSPQPFIVGGCPDAGHRVYAADNLAVMSSLLSELSAKIDLVYIDPPFNTGTDFALRGRQTGHAYSDRHAGGLSGYLSLMHPRLQLIHQLLAPSGTLYVHCDHRASSYLRLLLDEIFGPDNLRAQIIWHYQSGGRQKRCWSAKHDVIWMYSKSDAFPFNLNAVGIRRGDLARNHMKRHLNPEGKAVYSIRSAGKVYTYSEDDLMTPADVWTDISHLQQKDPERTGYATQKPEKLLERIILASSNPGDLVADFFAGSGTTAAVAHRLGRKFLLSDSGPAAISTITQRLQSLNIPFALYTPSSAATSPSVPPPVGEG